MRIHTLLATIALAVSLVASAQEVRRDSVKVYFPQGKSELDPFFEGNGRRLLEFVNAAKQALREGQQTRLLVVACSSPEGSPALNERLAYQRARSISDYLHANLDFDENLFEMDFNRIDWDLFDALVRSDDRIPARDEVLEAVRSRDVDALRAPRLRGSWDYLLKQVFPQMRATLAILEYAEETAAPEPAPEPVEAEPAPTPAVRPEEPAPAPRPVYTVPALPDDDEELDFSEESGTGIWLKTNLPTLGLLEANLALELALGYRVTVSLPVYYSALDWFSPTTKYRLLATQPQLRLWVHDGYYGPFMDIHGTFGWYNFALPRSEWRVQDRDARHPAYGGGLGVGWRFRLDSHREDRWGLEFGLGGGYLHLDYDLFYNVENGRYARSEVRNYWGLDHASVSLTYRLGRKPYSRR